LQNNEIILGQALDEGRLAIHMLVHDPSTQKLTVALGIYASVQECNKNTF